MAKGTSWVAPSYVDSRNQQDRAPGLSHSRVFTANQSVLCNQNDKGAREMRQPSRALVVLAEDPDSALSIHTLTHSCW